MAMTTETTLQATDLGPSFTVNDVQESLRFYEKLGFGVEDRWEEDGVLLGVMLRAGKVRIGLTQDDWKKGRNRIKGAGMRIFIRTGQDIDQLAARAKAAGLSLDEEPHDTPWDTRAFGLTDPDGFKLTVTSQG